MKLTLKIQYKNNVFKMPRNCQRMSYQNRKCTQKGNAISA